MNLRIDRYEVERLLGEGAFGKVYLAVDPRMNRKVAVKVLATGTSDPETRRRFRLEARAIAALKHPNIIELYDYSGEDAPDLFLVMEYIDGLALSGVIARNGLLSEPTALCVAHELCLALGHAHRNRIVHRDLKPENVLLTNGRVVLSDFGVVKAFARNEAIGVTTVSAHTQIVGTLGFMAPEQLEGNNIDHRTDIFALGVLLFRIITDKLPYEAATVGEAMRVLKRGDATDPRKINPLLSPGIRTIIAKCVAPKPQNRFSDTEELRQHILLQLKCLGVAEVRQELARYEENPAAYAVEQCSNTVDAMLRDLKIALAEHDDAQANELLTQVRALAPVDERLLSVAGLEFEEKDGTKKLVIARTRRNKPKQLPFLVLGLVVGTLFGVIWSMAIEKQRIVEPPPPQAVQPAVACPEPVVCPPEPTVTCPSMAAKPAIHPPAPVKKKRQLSPTE